MNLGGTKRVRGPVAAMFLAASALLAGGGCATVGKEFEVQNVPKLAIGQTTRADVLKMFGEPWRHGLEDGRETWTYGRYRYSLFGPDKTRDLVVRFDDTGRVASYTFSSTEPEDRAATRPASGAKGG